MRVEILHNTTAGFSGYSEADALVSQYKYERADPRDEAELHYERPLEHIWRENNVVDGYELPVYYRTRSLSVGDVVVLSYSDESREAWCVENVGWEPVDLEAVAISLTMGSLTVAQEVAEILGRIELSKGAPLV